VADGVRGQDDVNGGNPQIGMDSGADPQMGADGGNGRRQECKKLVAAARNRRQKINISSIVPNNTKVILQAIFLYDEATEQAYCCKACSSCLAYLCLQADKRVCSQP
jgi:hypothetical protein